MLAARYFLGPLTLVVSSLSAARHYLACRGLCTLYTVMQNFNFTTILTYLYFKEKIYAKAPHLTANS